MLNKLFKDLKEEIYYGIEDYITQLAYNNSQSEYNLIMSLWEINGKRMNIILL